MEYKNFNIRIEGKQNGGYPIVVESEDLAEADGVLTLSADCLQVADQLKDLDGLEPGSPLPLNFGSSLYECLFKDTVGTTYYRSLGARNGDEQGLRIRLRLTAAEIASLPWEVLYDRQTKCFLATSDKTPLTRYIDLVEPIRALKIEPPVKVLTLIPSGTGLDVDTEEKIIEEALGKLPAVEVSVLKDRVTRAEISNALNEKQYHILHFIGHGEFADDEGHLVIDGEDGEHELISAEVFADFFRNEPSLKLVVLNACQGAEVSATKPLAGIAPQLVARGIPAVVAMQYPISDEAAVTFAREFYLKLCAGWNRGQVDAAISHARNRIRMDVDEPLAFATPVLFLRSPTGVIFDFREPRGAWTYFTNLFSRAPVKQVTRLKEVKKTYQNNIAAWQELAQDADQATRKAAAAAIVSEQEEISDVDRQIVKWNRAFLASVVVAIAIFLLGYTGLFNIFHADDWLESRFIPYMENYVVKRFNPNVRLIMSDEGVNGDLGQPGVGWRAYHASLVDALAGKAKVIVFDLKMVEASPADEQLAGAIKRAEAKGTRVVLGKRVRDDGAVLADIPSTLQNAVNNNWGNIDVVGQHWGFVRVYQLGQSADAQNSAASRTQISVPSLALQATTQFLAPNSPASSFDESAERIQIGNAPVARSIPVYQTQPTVFDLPYDMVDYGQIQDATRSYRDVYAHLQDADYLRFFQDKIVIVGFKTPEELFSIAQGQRRYGAEIHANVVSDILGDVYLRWLPASYDLLIVAVLAGVGALVSARLPNTFTAKVRLPYGGKQLRVPGLLILTIVVYLLIAFLSYKFGSIYILRTHHLVAPFVAYWLTAKMRRRTALKPAKGVAA